MSEKRYHRIAFYPNGWSNFDQIEECAKPEWCVGCTYKHPFCEEFGKPIGAPPPQRMEG